MRYAGFVALTVGLAALLAPALARADDDRRGPPGNSYITVAGFEPQSGPPGTIVTIHGSGFRKQTKVLYNGIPVRRAGWDGERIQFYVPSGARGGLIVLRHPGARNDVVVGEFRVVLPGPVERPSLSSFSPEMGPPGTRVALYGRFLPNDVVYFDGRALPLAELAPDRATVVIPPGTRDDAFTLVRPSTGERVTSAGRFRVAAPPPFIAAVNPPGGPPGTQVRISGGGFGPEDDVTYGRRPIPIVGRSDQHFDVVIPADAVESRHLVVRGPRGEARSPTEFNLVIDMATIGSFEPATGPPYARVAIFGRGFRHGDEVLFGGRELRILELSPERIVVTMPAGGSDVFSLRRNGRILARSMAGFVIFEPPPVISGFSPPGGPPGTQVTISGSGFTPDVRVAYGGQALLIIGRHGDQGVVVEVPRSAMRSEPFIVSARAGETRSGRHFELALPAVVDRLSPTSGPPGTQVTIRGRGFRGDEVFYLGQAPLDVLERRAESVVARIPGRAHSAELSFDSLGGRYSTPLRFEVLELPIFETFAPAGGPPRTAVSIRGQRLGDVASVFYGGLPAVIIRRSSREIVVEIPAAAQGADYLWLVAPGRAGEVRCDVPRDHPRRPRRPRPRRRRRRGTMSMRTSIRMLTGGIITIRMCTRTIPGIPTTIRTRQHQRHRPRPRRG
jgi:hypothetical protein